MKNLLTLILLAAAGYYAYQQIIQPKGIYDESGNAKTLLFVFDACGSPCDQAQNFLARRSIPYEPINLSSDPEAGTRLRSLGGSSTMPQLYTGTRRVDGFHQLRYKEALGETYGLDVLGGNDREAFANHFNSDGSPKLVMYATDWCPHCKKAREYFQDNGLAYKEWDVEKESEGKRYFDTLEGTGYPVIYVGFRRVNTNGVKAALKEHPSLSDIL